MPGRSAIGYAEEALRCFTRNCNTAAALLLGVAAEASFLNLCGHLRNALGEPREQKKLDSLRTVKEKHRWIVDKFDRLPKPSKAQLPDGLRWNPCTILSGASETIWDTHPNPRTSIASTPSEASSFFWRMFGMPKL